MRILLVAATAWQIAVEGLECQLGKEWVQAGRRLGGAALAALQVSSNSPVLSLDRLEAWSYSGVQEKARDSVYEVWDLLDKYYYDSDTLRSEAFKKSRINLGEEALKEPKRADELRMKVVKSLGADKYTRLINAAEYEAISKYDILGIGLIIAPGDDERCHITSPPLPGSSAAKAGLSTDDIIVSIDGVSTKGLSSFDYLDIVSKFEKDSIDLELASGRELTLARRVDAQTDPIRNIKLSPDGTGYFRVTEFNSRTDKRIGAVLSELIDQEGAKAIVIDLRGNRGGAFQSAIDAASYFLPTGTPLVDIVEQEKVPGSPLRSVFKAKDKQPPLHKFSIPLELWIDRNSASSSEVFAGALRDNCAALIAGNEPSYGKGVVQAVLGLNQADGGLIVTVAQYFTPSNIPIQGNGIKPDSRLPSTSFGFLQPLPLPQVAQIEADFSAVSSSCRASATKATAL